MQRHRADYSKTDADGAIRWYTRWIGGPTLAKIGNCRVDGYHRRLTVYVTGEPYSFSSVPAATRIRGQYVPGVIQCEDGCFVFYARQLLPSKWEAMEALPFSAHKMRGC